VAKEYQNARILYQRAVALGSLVAANNLVTLFDLGFGGRRIIPRRGNCSTSPLPAAYPW
jgi:hypothetical protein